jgi:GTP cyclohydrolase II
MSDPLIQVDRAISELRRGATVMVFVGETKLLMMAVEGVTEEKLKQMRSESGHEPALVMTGTRAKVLGLKGSGDATSLVRAQFVLDKATIDFLTDPLSARVPAPDLFALSAEVAGRCEQACVTLSKLSRLLPAAVVANVSPEVEAIDAVSVQASAIETYMHNAADTLNIVSQARVPLENAENAKVVAFRPRDGGIEHLAIVVGDPDLSKPVLVRLHSECFTGDLVGSLRCDCGNQLRGAITAMNEAGSGVLLYLAQEGRGIGLVNKLRAYQLQDAGFDTVDANLQLGFDSDERNYLPAAQMLRLLNISKVRLLTNNPIKVDALARHGIEVVERVPHIFPSNEHNHGYLKTKATKSGHMF